MHEKARALFSCRMRAAARSATLRKIPADTLCGLCCRTHRPGGPVRNAAKEKARRDVDAPLR